MLTCALLIAARHAISSDLAQAVAAARAPPEWTQPSALGAWPLIQPCAAAADEEASRAAAAGEAFDPPQAEAVAGGALPPMKSAAPSPPDTNSIVLFLTDDQEMAYSNHIVIT